ncbi:phospholipase A2 [Anolis sagrei]|uniref:phospholipase A2 n=1 Tax=Anolis sagrei TaxID=38937 RepID=UPI0035225326
MGRPPPPPLLLLLLSLLFLLPLLQGTEAAGRGRGNAPLRSRRGIFQLAGAILCSTGRTPLAYLRYGCYCGLGGSGWPRDKADWCCFRHDCCYAEAEKEGCDPKMGSYPWECEDKEASCDDIKEDKCQKLACKCDREAAHCLSEAPYQPTYVFWPLSSCGSRSPKCKGN